VHLLAIETESNAGLIHQLEYYFRVLNGSGHINYVSIPLPSMLYAFVCNTFRISYTIHIMHFVALCITLREEAS
jgi:hypothetical protein